MESFIYAEEGELTESDFQYLLHHKPLHTSHISRWHLPPHPSWLVNSYQTNQPAPGCIINLLAKLFN